MLTTISAAFFDPLRAPYPRLGRVYSECPRSFGCDISTRRWHMHSSYYCGGQRFSAKNIENIAQLMRMQPSSAICWSSAAHPQLGTRR